jgi:hypothetical protein
VVARNLRWGQIGQHIDSDQRIELARIAGLLAR